MTFQAIILLLSRWIRNQLLTANKLHVTVSILFNSVLVQFFALCFSLGHWQHFALTGTVVPGTRTVGSVLSIVSELLIVYILIFLGKGWSLIRYKISSAGRVKIAALMTFTVFWELAVQAWKADGIDAARVLYIYSTGPGLMIIWIRVFTAFWFAYCCWTTMKSFDNKKHFYRKFLVFGFTWMLLKPIMAFICNAQVADTHREKYMVGWETAILFAVQLTMLLMYMPNQKFNRGFPFHKVSSAMLGLVQGQSASQYLLDQQRAAQNASGSDDNATSTTLPGQRASPSGRGAFNPNGGPPMPLAPVAETNNALDANQNQLRRVNGTSLPAAKRVIRDVGTELHRTMSELGLAGEDLLARLRDLDDVEGDVDFDERMVNSEAPFRRILHEESGW